MRAILEGRGRADAFVPAPGLKEFLLALKERRIKIALVTSGLLREGLAGDRRGVSRAWTWAIRREFYDAIITAGFPLRRGEVGTLGELSPKPHPWLYAEAARVGLGIPFEARNSVVGIEDSGAGVCAIRLAGFPTIGMAGGNIVESGTRALCDFYCETFAQVLQVLDEPGAPDTTEYLLSTDANRAHFREALRDLRMPDHYHLASLEDS